MSEESSSCRSRWKQHRETLAGHLRVRGAKEWGSFITGFYLGLIAVYVISQWGDFCDLPPNELGDFLAGAFGPVAFLWLILGYLQQGDELRQNGEALRMQAEELAKSVEQHKELVRASQEQVAVNREALRHDLNSVLPRFEFIHSACLQEFLFQGCYWNRAIVIFICRNSNAYNIEIVDLDPTWKKYAEADSSKTKEDSFHLEFIRKDEFPSELYFSLRYTNSEGVPRSQDVHLQKLKGQKDYMPKLF
ncbi:MAG: hypothetical protein EOP87_10950 [Verrucomicrobiaceae bacterium]|nr:MAG: hypothetical protein EOP87_10950 [Verrucomicrobiaceae bacterium]